jgi:hypothetical protein
VRNEDDKVVHIGGIDGNKPRQCPYRMNGPVSSTLTTGDIKGAQSSTKDKGSFSTRKRKDFRDINQTADIEGS